jgi:hypothetical protein
MMVPAFVPDFSAAILCKTFVNLIRLRNSNCCARTAWMVGALLHAACPKVWFTLVIFCIINFNEGDILEAPEYQLVSILPATPTIPHQQVAQHASLN